ncbi:MAG: hypothetical protein JNL54_09505 [Kineosporiaceae bacterium]|nr:hypothetical protein [Kineosporiaceae bacterium]
MTSGRTPSEWTSSERDLVIAVDHGSGGAKVGLVTLTGEILWSWAERRDAVHSSTEQDAERWWTTITRAVRDGLEATAARERVIAVAVTGQWSSTVPVDAEGRPVGPCLMWNDTQGIGHSRERFAGPALGYAPRNALTWLRRSGGIPSPSGADPVSHMLHLDRDRPELHDRLRWYLEPVDYLTMRFTGIAAATVLSMFPSWLIDNRVPGAAGYDPVLVARAGINPARLPPLVPAESVIGTVRADVAGELGIPLTTAVVPGLPDIHNAAIASGALGSYETHLGLGTSSWVSCPVPSKVSSVRWQMASVPGIGEAGYQLINGQDNGGRALDWFHQAIAPDLDHRALLALAAAAPAGSGGVLFTPWLTGEHSPIDDRAARGGFHNVSLDTGRGELARAVMEGVGLNTRWLLTGVERVIRHRVDSVRVLGGAARHDLWCQILADTTSRTVHRVADPTMAGVRGAALWAGLCLHTVSRTELARLVPIDAVFTPDPANRAIHERMFAEFPGLYSGAKGMFRRLNG